MPLFGIIADVHGNLDALVAVLEAAAREGVERMVCLGDIVGYNPFGNECVAQIRDRGVDSIAGNHDLIALERLHFDLCADKAAFALQRTRRDLTAVSKAFLATLPLRRTYDDDDLVLIHGGFHRPTDYMTGPHEVAVSARALRRSHPRFSLCCFGHTHRAGVYELHDEIVAMTAPDEPTALNRVGAMYFVNPGSVDAARRAESKLAEFALFESTTRVLRLLRVPYAHDRAERLARERGYRMNPWDKWRLGGARRLQRLSDKWLRIGGGEIG